MNIIGNNCGSSFYYKKKNEKFTNPFTWCVITPKDIISLIENFDVLDFNKITTVTLDYSIFQNNNLITQKIIDGGQIKGIKIDNSITVYYPHYLIKTICDRNSESIDVYCEDNEKYILEKYYKRLSRMKEDPVFLIITYPCHNWTINDIIDLSKIKSDKKIILITNYIINYPKNFILIKDNLNETNAEIMINKHFCEIDNEITSFYEKTL